MIEGIGLDGGNYVAAKKMMDLIDLNHRANTTNIAHLETPKFQRVQVKEGEKTDFAQLWGFTLNFLKLSKTKIF